MLISLNIKKQTRVFMKIGKIKFMTTIFFFLLMVMNVTLTAYETPFQQAIVTGDVESVKTLIAKGENINQSKDFAPLHLAAYHGRSEIVELLVEHGANVNLDVKNIGTPLNYCAVGLMSGGPIKMGKDSYIRIMQFLIDSGANIDAKDTHNRVPLYSAIVNPIIIGPNAYGICPDTEYAELLIDNGADFKIAIKSGLTEETLNKFEQSLTEKYSTYKNFESQFEIHDLNTLQSNSSSAYCINDKGQIVGSYLIQNKKFFFIQSSDGEMSLIDLPSTAEPIKLSNRGFIAGNYFYDRIKRGFFWSPETGFIDLGSLGGETTIACDMNEKGQIVGQSETSYRSLIDSTFEKHAFIWQRGIMLDLGTLTGDLGLSGDESIAYHIHNSGTILGSSNVALCYKDKIVRGNAKAIIREKSDSNWHIISNETNQYLAAYAINDKKDVILTKSLPLGQTRVVIFNLDSKTETPLLNSHKINSAKIMKNGLVALKSSNVIWVFIPKAAAEKICYTPTSPIYQLSQSPLWTKINVLQDVNIWGNFVGQGMNIYGEKQAIILRPSGINEFGS